jgi:phospholipid-binding lipoprotein MlaA
MTRIGKRALSSALLAFVLTGHAWAAADSPPDGSTATARSSDDAGDDDPLEAYNRKIFAFNDGFDNYVLRPVATGWDAVLPDPVERSLANFFQNLRAPVRFVNHLLQGDIDPAAITLSRFVVNTTVGVAGFFDVASTMDLPEKDADFGQTLGRYGVPPGPYIVWPILGSSNPRDSVGIAADSYLNVATIFVNFYILLGARAVDLVNNRAIALDTVEGAREASLDFYSAVRTAYMERRRQAIEGENPTRKQKREEELYFPAESNEGITP